MMSLRILAQSSWFLTPLDHHRNDRSVSRMSCSGPSSELSTPQRHRGKSRWLRRTLTPRCKSTGKIPRPIFLCAPWWFHRESILWPPSRTPLQPLRHTCNTSSDTCVAIRRQWVDIILEKRFLGLMNDYQSISSTHSQKSRSNRIQIQTENVTKETTNTKSDSTTKAHFKFVKDLKSL